MVFELQKWYQYIGEERIDAHSINQIELYLREQHLPPSALYEVPEMHSFKTGEGKFSQRLSKILYKEYGIGLSPEQKATLGRMASENLLAPESRHIIITTGCEGRREEYKNGSSCYWTDFSDARDWIAENGGGAIRIYTLPEMSVRTIVARVWWVPFHNGMIIFNSYGIQPLEKMAIILKNVLETDIQRLPVNQDTFQGPAHLYMNPENNGGGKPFYIGPKIIPSNSSHFVFFWEEPVDWVYANEDTIACEECGRRIDEDNASHYDGTAYCYNCFSDRFFNCVNCDEPEWHDESHHINGYGDVCRDCFENGDFFFCQSCEDNFTEEDIVNVEGSFHCQSCAEGFATPCDTCGEWHPDTEIVYPNLGGAYCSECAPEEMNCAECGLITDDLQEYREQGTPFEEAAAVGLFCADCIEKFEHMKEIFLTPAPVFVEPARYARTLL